MPWLFETYVGRATFRFFGVNLSGAKGGTTPLAFPRDTIVPLRAIVLKLSSHLQRDGRRYFN